MIEEITKYGCRSCGCFWEDYFDAAVCCNPPSEVVAYRCIECGTEDTDSDYMESHYCDN